MSCAVEQDAAAVGLHQAHDRIEAGGLAGAVGAEQAEHLAAVDAERDVGQHRLLVVGFGDRDDRQAVVERRRSRRRAGPVDGDGLVHALLRYPAGQVRRSGARSQLASFMHAHGTVIPATAGVSSDGASSDCPLVALRARHGEAAGDAAAAAACRARRRRRRPSPRGRCRDRAPAGRPGRWLAPWIEGDAADHRHQPAVEVVDRELAARGLGRACAG